MHAQQVMSPGIAHLKTSAFYPLLAKGWLYALPRIMVLSVAATI